MLKKIDVLLYNLIALAGIGFVLFMQFSEATAHVDKFSNLFN